MDTPETTNGGSWPRILSGVLGAWLVASAFLWPHSPAQLLNTLICGVLVMAFALAALRWPQLRYVDTALGVWLFVSAFALRTPVLETDWNEIFAGIAIIAASVVPSRPKVIRPLLHLHRRAPMPFT